MIARVGDLVEVRWLDASGVVNATVDDAELLVAVNVGWIAQMDKRSIVLQSGRYDGQEVGDFTAIPRDWTTKVRVIERGSA